MQQQRFIRENLLRQTSCLFSLLVHFLLPCESQFYQLLDTTKKSISLSSSVHVYIGANHFLGRQRQTFHSFTFHIISGRYERIPAIHNNVRPYKKFCYSQYNYVIYFRIFDTNIRPASIKIQMHHHNTKKKRKNMMEGGNVVEKKRGIIKYKL